MRSDEFDSAEMLKRLQRQVANLQTGDTDETVTLVQAVSDGVAISDSVGFASYGVTFDGSGTSDYIALNTDYADPQQFTISCFVRPDNLSGGGSGWGSQAWDTSAWGGGGGDWRHVVGCGQRFVSVTSNASVGFRVPGVDTTAFTAGAFSAGDVLHLACTYDQADRVIYIDGREVAREAIGSGTVALGNFTLGGDGTTSTTFAGPIDTLTVHDRALSLTEVRSLAQHQRVTNGLVGEWTFNAGPGTAPTDSVSGTTGTMNGAAYAGPLEWEYDPGFVWMSDPWNTDEW